MSNFRSQRLWKVELAAEEGMAERSWCGGESTDVLKYEMGKLSRSPCLQHYATMQELPHRATDGGPCTVR